MMVNSAEQLVKYKKILAKLQKDFPKKSTYKSFTINVFYGGNKEVDIQRVTIGGASNDLSMGNDFYNLLVQSVQDNISFWEGCVKRDLKELEDALNF